MRIRAILTLCGISLLWGSGWTVAPLLAQTAAPCAAAALTFALAAAFLRAVLLGLRFGSVREAREAIPVRISLRLALGMLAFPTALLLAAGEHGVSGWVPLLYAFLPLLAAGSAWSPAMIVAIGAVLLLLGGTVPLTPMKLLWAVPALAGVALQAFALRYAARQLRGASARALLASLGLQCAVAAGLLGVGSLFFDAVPKVAPPSQWSGFSLTGLLCLAIAGTALTYAGLYWLLARGTLAPWQAAVAQWLQTLLAVAESAALARTWPGWQSLAGALVLAGCAWSVLGAKPADQPPSIAAQGTLRP